MIGRWQPDLHHEGVTPHDRNELARHREQLAEWIAKREEAAFAIRTHRAEIRKLERRVAHAVPRSA